MNSDLKQQLRELYITGAKVISSEIFIVHPFFNQDLRSIPLFQEIEVQGKKALIIFVPVPQLRAYQKIQSRLVRELEKKFSGKHVVFIAQVLF